MARRPVDEKIIKLTMDNSDLSEKAAKSVELIKKLKDTLNKIPGVNIGKAGDNIAKIGEEAGKSRVGLAAVADGVDQIAERFSSMGIVGTEVLRRVTNSGLDMIENLAKKAWNQTMTAGKQRAKNIEQAAFQFKGLGMDVDKAMESANYAVVGTNYGLDEAALAASALGAAGVEAGDDMSTALRSISGVAAMTNSSYGDTARIFTRVAGQGRLMADQLNQFAGRGLNVAAMMAKEFGISESRLREMVSKGQISFTQFYKTMDKLFGEHATSSRSTFEGAMAAMKSALTRVGETIWTPVLTHSRESLLVLMDLFNAIHDAIKPIAKDLEPYVEAFFRSFDKFVSGIDLTNFGPTLMAIYKGIMNIGTAIGRILGPIVNAFRALVGIDGSPIYGLAKAFEWLTSKLILPLKVSEILETVLTSITSTVNSTVMAVINGISRVFTALKDIPGLIDKFTTKFVEGAVAAGKWMGNVFINIPVDKIKEFGEYLKTLNAGEWLGNFITNIPFEKLGQFGENLKKLSAVFEDQFFVQDNNLLWSINNTLRIALEALGVNFDKFDKAVNRIEKAWSNFLKIFEGIDLKDTFSAGFLGGMASLISQIIANIDRLTDIGDFVRNIGTELDKLAVMFKEKITDLNQNVFPGMWAAISEYLSQLKLSTESLGQFTKDLASTIATKLTPAWETFSNLIKNISLEPLLVAFRELGRFVMNIISPIWNLIKDIITNITWEDVFAGGFLVGIGMILDNMKESFGGLKEIWDKITGIFSSGDGDLGAGPVSDFLGSVADSLTSFSDSITEGVTIGRIVAVATAVGILAASMHALSDLDTQQITNGMAAIATAVVSLSLGIKALDFVNLQGVGMTNVLAFAVAVRLLVGAIKQVGDLDPSSVGQGILALGTSTFVLTKALKTLDTVKLTTAPGTIMAMGLLIKMLVSSLKSMEGMSGLELLQNASTIGLLALEMAAFGKLMDDITIEPRSIVSMLLLSGVIKILVNIMDDINNVEGGAGGILTSLITIGAILGVLGAFAKMTDEVEIKPSSGIAVMGIAAALIMLIKPIKALAEMEVGSLITSIGGIGLLLTAIATFSEAVEPDGMVSAAVGTALMAGALTLLIVPVKKLGKMDWEDLQQGIGAVTVLLMGMTVSMVAASQSAGGGAAFALLAVGLTMMLVPIKQLGKMDWKELIDSLAKFAVTVGVIAGVSALLEIAAPAIAALAASLITLGGAVALIGIGLSLLATGLSVVATLSVATITGAVASIGIFLAALTKLVPTFGKLVLEILETIIEVILGLVDQIAELVVGTVLAILRVIDEKLPEFIEIGASIIKSILKGIHEEIPEFLDELGLTVASVVNGLAMAIDEHHEPIIDAVLRVIGAVLVAVVYALESVLIALLGWFPGVESLATWLGETLTESIEDSFKLNEVVEEEFGVVKARSERLGEELGLTLKESSEEAVRMFDRYLTMDEATREAFDEMFPEVIDAQGEFSAETAIMAIKGTESFKKISWKPAADHAVDGLERQFTYRSRPEATLWQKITHLGKGVLKTLNRALGNQSPSKYTKESGENLVEGLMIGLDNMTGKAISKATSLGSQVVEATNSMLDASVSDLDTEVRVRVVMDTTDLDKFNPDSVKVYHPNTSFVNSMADASRPNYNQNEDKMYTEPKESNEYNYDVHIHATGELPRATIRRMAHQFKDEIDTIDRRSRINRGEEVVY